MGANLAAISKPKEIFFSYGHHIELIPNKSNWFEGEPFDGILSITVEQNCPPLQVDI